MTRTDITKELIEDLYLNREMDMGEIAVSLKCGGDTLSRYMKIYEIPRRVTQGRKPTINISKEELHDLYWNREMSLSDIADALGCSQRSVARLMEEHDIPRRTASKAAAKIEISKEELHDLYWNREMSMDAIADILGCHIASIFRAMRKHGIKSREREEYRTKIKTSKDEFYDLYWNREMSLSDIANELGCSMVSVGRIRRKYDIPCRPQRGCSSPLEKNPNWNGGSSFEPYCHKFNERFKESIREKFNRTCFLCPTTEQAQMEEMRSRRKRAFRLSIHHVDYNKDCLCDDSDCEFVPLCVPCHNKTNHNREYWEETIMDKLEVMKCE